MDESILPAAFLDKGQERSIKVTKMKINCVKLSQHMPRFLYILSMVLGSYLAMVSDDLLAN